MLPTFVIGLREGLEAALIVGIIAAFLRKQGRRDLLRWVWLGVMTAIGLCVAAGVLLDVLSKDLPQRQQEGLETVIGALAVGMVTYMVVWMKRNSRNLKGQLEGLAADAMGTTSGAARAMIAMAFLAVLREGVETVIFLLAAFNQSRSGPDAVVGAVLGILVAVGLGYGINRGGVRINLSKFFRATGLVLVLVAAGLVVNALRTAHEAGWLEVGQGSTVDLTWLVDPGSVQASLLTGMLGMQSRPVVIEVIGWLVYLVPVGVYVAWPPGSSPARRSVSRVLLGSAAVLAVVTVVLALVAPARPASRPATAGDQVVSVSGGTATVRLAATARTLRQGDGVTRGGIELDVYTGTHAGTLAADLPGSVGYDRVGELNGGHLPIGLRATGGQAQLRYADQVRDTVWIEPRTGRIVDARTREQVTAAVVGASGALLPLSTPVRTSTSALPARVSSAALHAAARDVSTLHRRSLLLGLGWTAGVLAGLCLLAGLALAIRPRRKAAAIPDTQTSHLVRS
jgi:high-affinity iron transporter